METYVIDVENERVAVAMRELGIKKEELMER
jgi:hypothetical protein